MTSKKLLYAYVGVVLVAVLSVGCNTPQKLKGEDFELNLATPNPEITLTIHPDVITANGQDGVWMFPEIEYRNNTTQSLTNLIVGIVFVLGQQMAHTTDLMPISVTNTMGTFQMPDGCSLGMMLCLRRMTSETRYGTAYFALFDAVRNSPTDKNKFGKQVSNVLKIKFVK